MSSLQVVFSDWKWKRKGYDYSKVLSPDSKLSPNQREYTQPFMCNTDWQRPSSLSLITYENHSHNDFPARSSSCYALLLWKFWRCIFLDMEVNAVIISIIGLSEVPYKQRGLLECPIVENSSAYWLPLICPQNPGPHAPDTNLHSVLREQRLCTF